MTKIEKAHPYKNEEMELKRALNALIRAHVLKERSEIAALVRSAHERTHRDNQEFRNILLAIDVRAIP